MRRMASSPTLAQLRSDIVRRHESLSPRLKQVAAFVLEHPNDIGLQTLAVIAGRCHVQPSTVVRFAKAFGYDGASEMQKLFREEILSFAPSPSYADRVQQLAERAGSADPLSPHGLLQEFADNNALALEHLKSSVPRGDLEAAVHLIRQAETIFLIGLRRSFPVASYLAYALPHVENKRAWLIDGLAGMLSEQGAMLRRGDLLIATSFRPYAKETAEIVAHAREAGAGIIAISDSRLAPIARGADIVFEIKDAEVRQFRSLTASLCLAQTLVISYAFQTQAGKPGGSRRGGKRRQA
ncbi:MAG: MurR/RpiR family transcriptional regulator [Gammaproteobacteria bacterium]|nr:MurR/RpiR family transcriptional regulator [Gammaproteobacteria bacterium]